MANFRVEPCSEEHILALAPNLAEADQDEIWAMERGHAESALRRGLKVSDEAWAWLVNDEVMVIYGVYPRTLVSPIGMPWTLSSKNLGRYAVSFIKESKLTSDRWLHKYSGLENYVDSRHEKSIRWLRYLGYSIDMHKPEPIGPDKIPFFKFWKRGY
jgi:hypothetical protein